MSGHSHWSSIKHKKGATDVKRSKVFSKIARTISVAAKEKGESQETNPALRLAIEQAKKVNMPANTIERSIKKGTGELNCKKKYVRILDILAIKIAVNFLTLLISC